MNRNRDRSGQTRIQGTSTPAQVCEVHWLGRIDYSQAWTLQKEMAQEIGSHQRLPTLLLLEHPPTYTFGRSGKASNLLWDENELARRGIQSHWVDRGGDITYHGPGQLVGYPLLPLKPQSQPGDTATGKIPAGRLPRTDYIGYLRRLEKTLLLALEKLGVAARTIQGYTGIWVELPVPPGESTPSRKIAAIGVKVDVHGISQHGFALNVNPDMEHWQGIIPCGIENCQVTSLAELVSPCPDMALVRKRVTEAFAEVFGYEIRIV